MKLELNEKEPAIVSEALKIWLHPISYLTAKVHSSVRSILLGRCGRC